MAIRPEGVIHSLTKDPCDRTRNPKRQEKQLSTGLVYEAINRGIIGENVWYPLKNTRRRDIHLYDEPRLMAQRERGRWRGEDAGLVVTSEGPSQSNRPPGGSKAVCGCA